MYKDVGTKYIEKNITDLGEMKNLLYFKLLSVVTL